MLRLKKYFKLLIIILNINNICCVSDFSDSEAESYMEELDTRHTKSEAFEDDCDTDVFGQNISSKKSSSNYNDCKKDAEIRRLSSELIIVNEQVKELRERFNTQDQDKEKQQEITSKIRAQQIIDFIDSRQSKEEKKIIETTMPQLLNYINYQAKDGETPLNRSISACNYNFFSILVFSKANPDIANSSGKTARDYIKVLKDRKKDNNNLTEDEKKIIKLWNSKFEKLNNDSKFNKLKRQFSQQIKNNFKQLKNRISSSYEQ